MSDDPRLVGHACGPECDHEPQADGGTASGRTGPPRSLAALRATDDYTLRSLRIAANGTPWRSSASDPTATKQIRKRYEGEMYRRFRKLKGAILKTVVELDAFGLKENGGRVRSQVAALTERERELMANVPGQDAGIDISPPEASPGAFDFPADEDKIDEFNEWLDTQVDRGILERGKHTGRTTAASRSWQNAYIRSAYERGVEHADEALVEQGVIPPEQTLDDVFRATKHVDGAGILYTRAFSELDAVTQDMARDMTRELTEGFTQGENPRKIARRLNDRVDKVGLHRGRMIARTETIRAHNEAGLNRYEDMGDRLDGVTTVAEHTTAGDNRVCPECQFLNGRRYNSISNARGRIPVHPNCRCTFVPIQVDEKTGRVTSG